MASIKRLPDHVHSVVASTILFFDFARVVEELLYNSIDAASAKVDVALSVKSSSLKVTDDGSGITRDGLLLLGEKYVSSKHYPLDASECGTSNTAFKGETLGSLSDISLLQITTKARGWPNAYTKIIKGSKCIYMGIDDKREAVGTTVVVRELFYNQPVRRRCMQSSLNGSIMLGPAWLRDKLVTIPKKELDSVKKCVLRIALVHPQISFRVYDLDSEDEILCTVPSSSPLPLISDGFGKDVSCSLRAIFHSDQLLTLSGFISGPSDPFSTKALQYLYINSRFVRKNPIHNLINNLATRWQSCTDQNGDELVGQSRKRAKHVSYPAFLLNLCCPSSSYDLNYEPSKTVVEFKDLNFVLAFFEEALTNYWKVMSQCTLEETYHAEDTSLSLKEEMLKEEGLTTVMSERGKKPKVSWLKNTIKATDFGSSNQRKKKADSAASNTCTQIKSDSEATDHNGLYETHKNACASFLDIKPCTRSASHSHWSNSDSLFCLEDEYPQMSTPMVGAKYSFRSFKEDEPFLQACTMQSRDNSYRVENENPMKGYMYDCMEFENSSEDCFNPWSSTINCIQHYWYGNFSRSVWDSPSASLCDLVSPQKNFFFDSPLCARNGSNPNKCRKQRKLMENEDEFSESARDILSGGSILSCKKTLWDNDSSSKKSQFFDFPIDGTPFSTFLDSPIIEMKPPASSSGKSFLLWDSPITEKAGWGHRRENLPEGQNLQCYSSARKCKFTLRPRSSSAPPFYKGKCKFSYLNDQLTSLIGEESASNVFKTSSDTVPVLNTTPENCLSQPCPDPALFETLQLNIRGEQVQNTAYISPPCQHDNFEHTGDELTKWRVEVQPTVVSLPHISTDDVLNISSGLLHLSSNSLIPASIDRNCFDNVKVLLQLDKKFIPVIASDTLVILDQHAADERIRLEDLRGKVLSGEGCGSTFLNPAEELVLPEMGFQLLEKYGAQIKKWGWLTSIDSQSSDPFTKSMSFLKRQEGNNFALSLVAVPCILGTNLTSKDLLEFLEQLVETDGSGNLPPAITRILNLKACRGAIMFGDPLLPSECSLILEELKATSLCFQCAHGRPTTVPLINIKQLHVELEKLKMQNLRTKDKWHGLMHHKLSVEYVQRRLHHAKI